MGYRLNFTVDKEYIDTYSDGDVFSPELLITGSSVTDTVCITCDGVTIGMSDTQFLQMVLGVYEKSYILDSLVQLSMPVA